MNVTFLATLERASHEFVRVVLNKFFWGDFLWQTSSQPCMPVTILRVQTEKTAWLVVDWAKIFRAGWRRFCFLSEMIVQRKIWMKIGRLGTFGPLPLLGRYGFYIILIWSETWVASLFSREYICENSMKELNLQVITGPILYKIKKLKLKIFWAYFLNFGKSWNFMHFHFSVNVYISVYITKCSSIHYCLHWNFTLTYWSSKIHLCRACNAH